MRDTGREQALFFSAVTAMLLAIAITAQPVMAESSQAGDQGDSNAHENYRVLQWQDLVPAGWEPPLVPTAYDDASAADVDASSVVGELDRQLSALPGYMRPIVFEGNAVSEFLLVPFLPHQITAHAHLDPNQMVYVRSLEPVLVENPLEPIWVVGAMSVEPVMTEEGAAAYQIVDAVTTRYEY